MPKLGVGISGEADFYYHRYEKGMRNMAWKTKDRYAKDITEEVDLVKNDLLKQEVKNSDYVEFTPSEEIIEFPSSFKEIDSKPFKEMVKQSEKWKNMTNKETEKMTGSSQQEIETIMDEIRVMLLAKNEQYGDSALSPTRIFSKASADEQIKVRIDDKLSRLMLGNDSMESDEDVIKDLIGYLVLLLVSQGRQD